MPIAPPAIVGLSPLTGLYGSLLNKAGADSLQGYAKGTSKVPKAVGPKAGPTDTVPAMLTPGERVDATLDILDPGKDAEGFEIDVCLRGAGPRVSCAADTASQAVK